MAQDAVAKANLTCPECQAATAVDIPTDKCLAMYRCSGCGRLIMPKEGSCCVVCDYSKEHCPVSIKPRKES